MDQASNAADPKITGILNICNARLRQLRAVPEGIARTHLDGALRVCMGLCNLYLSGELTKEETIMHCDYEMAQCMSSLEAIELDLERQKLESEERERKEMEKNLLMEKEAILASLRLCERAKALADRKLAEMTAGK